LIEKMILVQMEDQYPFAMVYDQELGFYLFKQESLTNPQWYKGGKQKFKDISYR